MKSVLMAPAVFVLTLLLIAATCPPARAASAYDDVPEGHWSYAALHYLVDQGLIMNVSASKINGVLTRYEFSVATAEAVDRLAGDEDASVESRLVTRALFHAYRDQLCELSDWGSNVPDWDSSLPWVSEELSHCNEKQSTDRAYDDVPNTNWAYPALNYMTEKGILEGFPEGFFSGRRTLTAYEFAQAISRLQDALFSTGNASTVITAESDVPVEVMLANALKEQFADQIASLSVCKLGN